MGFVEKGFVYWIHKDSSDNIKSDGYVGITKNITKRFREHNSTNHNCTALKNAINKYGTTLLYDIIWEGCYSGALELEEYFRPFPQIGWNIRAGGIAPTFGPSTRKEMSISAKARGVSEATRKAHANSRSRQVGFKSPNNKPVDIYIIGGKVIASNVVLTTWCNDNMLNPKSAAQYLSYTAKGRQKLYNNKYYAIYIDTEVYVGIC